MREQKIIELDEYFDYDTDEFFEELKNNYGKNAKFVFKYTQNFDDADDDDVNNLCDRGIIDSNENDEDANYSKLLENRSSEFTNVTFTYIGNLGDGYGPYYTILSKPLSIKALRKFFEEYFGIEDEIIAFCSDTMTHTNVKEATLTIEYE